MSQEQPRRPVEEDKQGEEAPQYGDAYLDLAVEAVAHKDAAAAQNQKSSEPAGLKLINADEVRVSNTKQTDLRAGRRNVAESVGEKVTNPNSRHVDHEKERKIYDLVKVVGQYSHRGPPSAGLAGPPIGGAGTQITIGEALEATAISAGQKPVEWSDAAAIQAAEVRATGRTNIVPGGVAAAAQSAATLNARATRAEDKTKLADILTDATSKLPSDKAATRRDAEGVTGAEMRNDPFLTTHPTGVAASVAAAARLNQSSTNEVTK